MHDQWSPEASDLSSVTREDMRGVSRRLAVGIGPGCQSHWMVQQVGWAGLVYLCSELAEPVMLVLEDSRSQCGHGLSSAMKDNMFIVGMAPPWHSDHASA